VTGSLEAGSLLLCRTPGFLVSRSLKTSFGGGFWSPGHLASIQPFFRSVVKGKGTVDAMNRCSRSARAGIPSQPPCYAEVIAHRAHMSAELRSSFFRFDRRIHTSKPGCTRGPRVYLAPGALGARVCRNTTHVLALMYTACIDIPMRRAHTWVVLLLGC
jgi:hypothetical protein